MYTAEFKAQSTEDRRGKFYRNFYEILVPSKATIYRTVANICAIGSIVETRNQ
jgi:hypothetical protein